MCDSRKTQCPFYSFNKCLVNQDSDGDDMHCDEAFDAGKCECKKELFLPENRAKFIELMKKSGNLR